MMVLNHLPNVETRFDCPQAFLSLDFHCRTEMSELNSDSSGLKTAVTLTIPNSCHEKGHLYKRADD